MGILKAGEGRLKWKFRIKKNLNAGKIKKFKKYITYDQSKEYIGFKKENM